MAQSTKERLKEKKEKMKAKKETIKAKIKGATKSAAVTACCIVAAMLATTGCQTADPASRSNTATYGDLEPRITINGSSNYVHFAMTIGDGVIASADGGGDTQSNTPTQTTDTKPEIAVGVGGGSAGTGGGSQESGLTAKLWSALKGFIPAGSETAAKTAIEAACTDGNCAPTTK
jgi:hypothetical protein